MEYHNSSSTKDFMTSSVIIFIVLSAIVVICAYLYIDMYLTVKKISYEVLKIDHPKKLYVHQEFRPHLNRLIYRNKK